VACTFRYWTAPRTAGSLSLSGDAKGETFKDGTVKLGAGLAASSAIARGLGKPGNREIFGIGNPRYDRPFVATQAYVTVPRLLGWTTYPTIGYNLAEGRGSQVATSNGWFGIGEVAYNPLSNSFGVSFSQVRHYHHEACADASSHTSKSALYHRWCLGS
jgi:hypothetical protein